MFETHTHTETITPLHCTLPPHGETHRTYHRSKCTTRMLKNTITHTCACTVTKARLYQAWHQSRFPRLREELRMADWLKDHPSPIHHLSLFIIRFLFNLSAGARRKSHLGPVPTAKSSPGGFGKHNRSSGKSKGRQSDVYLTLLFWMSIYSRSLHAERRCHSWAAQWLNA